MKTPWNNSNLEMAMLIFACIGAMTILPMISGENECKDCIPIGCLFDQSVLQQTKGAFRLAMEQHNKNVSIRQQVHFLVDVISTRDAFKIARLVCSRFKRGVLAMVASVEPDSFDTLHSYANTFQMPLVTPWFPENVPSPSSGLMDYALSLRPNYHRAVIDMIKYYNWDNIIYFYDSHDGLLRLQDLFLSMQPSNASFSISVVQRVSSASEALEFLISLERRNRWSKKYVIFDSSTDLAKEVIKSHVKSVRLGRRNYHYLFSGLVMDDHWEHEVEEFGAINITGFRIVDVNRPFARNFLKQWRKLNPLDYPGAGEYISARSALMYDAVRVVTESVSRFLQGQSDTNPQDLFCDLEEVKPKPFRYGESIARFMRKVDIEGLTGNISFTNDGRRREFSLDVVEMTHSSQTVKIGYWNERYGFVKIANEYSNKPYNPGRQFTSTNNRTLIVTTILEKPFIMLKSDDIWSGNDRFEGYAKDLADLLAHKLGFNYTLHLVKDNTYGAQVDSMEGGWNGIVGELVRKEADISIAPLTITSSREQVIDFTKPFMTLGISIMMKRPVQKNAGIFSFMSPLSEEIWMCVVFALIGVSIVLFLVSRFSPYEWRVVEGFHKTTITNDFTIWNSLWFTMGAIMQQGIDLCPRSFSGRIVGSVWWFFTLILISSYTANLAAFLTVERMVTPIKGADDLSKQTEVEYGARNGGSTKEFFERTKIPTYSRMWEFMTSRKNVFPKTYEEGIERVRTSKGKYAFLLESVKNDYINEQLPCDTIKIGENLNTNGYGVATPKSSPLLDRLNMAILELTEDGSLAELKNRWWYERSQCGKGKDQEQATSSLTLSNVAGIFYILTGGLVVSLVVALFEFCYKSKMDASRAKLSLSDAMKAKARISITGGKDGDGGRNTSAQPLLGQTHFGNAQTPTPAGLLQQNNQQNQQRQQPHHQHHAHHHHHQHLTGGHGRGGAPVSSTGHGFTQTGMRGSHSQLSFSSNQTTVASTAITPQGSTPLSTASPQNTPNELQPTPTNHSFADLPF